MMLLSGCAGPVAELTTIPAEEAAWQAMAPRLAGMPAGEENRARTSGNTAARAAAPYVHPRLSAVDVAVHDGGPLVVEIVRFGRDDEPGEGE